MTEARRFSAGGTVTEARQFSAGGTVTEARQFSAGGTITEARWFSAGGTITEEAQQKIRQAREQLLCEDDFQRSMDAPPATRAEILKLLAATRSTWKGIQQAGLDVGMGTIEDVHQVTLVIQGLYRKAYDIDRQYGLIPDRLLA